MNSTYLFKKWLRVVSTRPSKKAKQSEEYKLTAKNYDEEYYRQHAKAGLNYLGHGYWHKSYAMMISEATLQSTYSSPFIVDAGCACGSILKGFKDLSIYSRVLGIDLSD